MPNSTAPGAASPPLKSPRLAPQQLQFLLRVAPPALATEREYDVPACITIAQAILESATPAGWGTSRLFLEAKNPFGIKYCHWNGTGGWGLGAGDKQPSSATAGQQPTTNARYAAPGPQPPVPSPQPPQDYGHFDAATWEIENGQRKEIIAQFQRFPNLEEAFRAHALLLARTPRYAPAMAVVRNSKLETGNSGDEFQLSSFDFRAFAERLGPKTSQLDSEHCGYSTNPSYSAVLVQLVDELRLNDPRMLQWLATGKDPGPGIATAVGS
jgi:hypothetical protein